MKKKIDRNTIDALRRLREEKYKRLKGEVVLVCKSKPIAKNLVDGKITKETIKALRSIGAGENELHGVLPPRRKGAASK